MTEIEQTAGIRHGLQPVRTLLPAKSLLNRHLLPAK
jgi:hypothetical protein